MTAMRSIVFLRRSVYNGKRPGDRLTHDIFKEDIMKKVLLAILVVAVIGTMCFAAVACKDEPTVVENDEIAMLMEGNYYVGTEGSVDLSTALPGSGYTVTGSNATLSGSTLTVSGTGDFTLKYNPTDKNAEGIADGSVTLTVHAVEGVNVSDWAGLVAAVAASKDVVIQKDLVSEGRDSVNVIDTTFYGNAKVVNVNSIVNGTADKKNRGNNGFTVHDDSVGVFQDMIIRGYEVEAGQSIALETGEGYGQLIDATNADSSKRPSLTIKHCILENGQKMVYVKGADCSIEGTVMRNGADALLAIETGTVKGSNVTVKNCSFANSVVCGIILCGWTPIENEESYCTLNLEGFVDIYNWKSRETAKLMPKTEQFNSVVNTVLKSELEKEEYNSYFTKGSDGVDYVHFGIVVLANGSLADNQAVINGLEGNSLVKKNFPLPGFVSVFSVQRCDLYCLENDQVIAPTDTIKDNENLSYELIHGRN